VKKVAVKAEEQEIEEEGVVDGVKGEDGDEADGGADGVVKAEDAEE
jgi:hypothetical protein